MRGAATSGCRIVSPPPAVSHGNQVSGRQTPAAMCEESERGSPESLSRVNRRKSQVYLWKDVTLHEVEMLERAPSDGDLRRALCELLKSGSCEPRASPLLDLYYYTVRFCWDTGFNREQTSCLFSIVKETHAACVGSPLGNVAECYRHFQDLLLRHAVHHPPFSISMFSPQQLLHVSDYIVKTYFRHFKLYKYVFAPQVNLDVSIIYDGISETEDTETSDEAGDKGTSGPGGSIREVQSSA